MPTRAWPRPPTRSPARQCRRGTGSRRAGRRGRCWPAGARAGGPAAAVLELPPAAARARGVPGDAVRGHGGCRQGYCPDRGPGAPSRPPAGPRSSRDRRLMWNAPPPGGPDRRRPDRPPGRAGSVRVSIPSALVTGEGWPTLAQTRPRPRSRWRQRQRPGPPVTWVRAPRCAGRTSDRGRPAPVGRRPREGSRSISGCGCLRGQVLPADSGTMQAGQFDFGNRKPGPARPFPSPGSHGEVSWAGIAASTTLGPGR